MIQIDTIRIDGGTQPRANIDLTVVQEYHDAIVDGIQLPPIDVFFDGRDYWLADGFHRYHAFKQAGYKEVPALVKNGTQRDAILFSIGANAAHGLRRTKEDKLRAIRIALDDFEFSESTDAELAKLCNMTRQTVNRLRKELGIEQKAHEVTRNGETFKQAERKPSKLKKPAEKPKKEAKQVEVVIDDTKTQELAHQVTELADENEELRAKLAVKQMDATEEEKVSALDTINELRNRIKDLERELAAVTTSRNDFQQKNAELLKQVVYWKKKADQLEKQAA